jgi:hypothetical protein
MWGCRPERFSRCFFGAWRGHLRLPELLLQSLADVETTPSGRSPNRGSRLTALLGVAPTEAPDTSYIPLAALSWQKLWAYPRRSQSLNTSHCRGRVTSCR